MSNKNGNITPPFLAFLREYNSEYGIKYAWGTDVIRDALIIWKMFSDEDKANFQEKPKAEVSMSESQKSIISSKMSVMQSASARGSTIANFVSVPSVSEQRKVTSSTQLTKKRIARKTPLKTRKPSGRAKQPPYKAPKSVRKPRKRAQPKKAKPKSKS